MGKKKTDVDVKTWNFKKINWKTGAKTLGDGVDFKIEKLGRDRVTLLNESTLLKKQMLKLKGAVTLETFPEFIYVNKQPHGDYGHLMYKIFLLDDERTIRPLQVLIGDSIKIACLDSGKYDNVSFGVKEWPESHQAIISALNKITDCLQTMANVESSKSRFGGEDFYAGANTFADVQLVSAKRSKKVAVNDIGGHIITGSLMVDFPGLVTKPKYTPLVKTYARIIYKEDIKRMVSEFVSIFEEDDEWDVIQKPIKKGNAKTKKNPKKRKLSEEIEASDDESTEEP